MWHNLCLATQCVGNGLSIMISHAATDAMQSALLYVVVSTICYGGSANCVHARNTFTPLCAENISLHSGAKINLVDFLRKSTRLGQLCLTKLLYLYHQPDLSHYLASTDQSPPYQHVTITHNANTGPLNDNFHFQTALTTL